MTRPEEHGRFVYVVLYDTRYSDGDSLHAVFEREEDADAYARREQARARTGRFRIEEMALR